MNRPDRLLLNGTWHFAVDADNSGVEQGYFRADYDPEGWIEVSVPSVFETCLARLRDYPGVWLEQGPLVRIDDVVIRAEPNPGGDGRLELLVSLENHLDEEQSGQLVFSVFPASESDRAASGSDRTASQLGRVAVKLPSHLRTSVPFSGDVADIALWTPSAPALYTLQVQLIVDGEIVSHYEHRFGFRCIEVADGRIVLNGKPVFLVGVNRHEELPGSLMAVNRELARKDLTLIKSLGVNFIRMCHYPHDRCELDLCDELGLLVLAEIPLNAYLFSFPFTHDHALLQALPDIEANARQMLDAMIRRDRNHPSVIVWSVSNETGEHIADVRALNLRLVDYARSLDATRLIVHVTLGSTWGSDYANQAYLADDIVCVNIYNYVEEIRSLREAGHKFDPEIAVQFWQDHVARIEALYPGKPVLVTEIGFPVRLPTDSDIQKQDDAADEEQLQADYLELMLSAAKPYVAGLSIWAWADHNWPHIWPEMESMFGQSVSTFGLISQDRRHLRKAADVLHRYTVNYCQ